MNDSLVSIVIPVKNAQATIKKCIDSIRRQSYKNYELIVVDDGSTDKTARILADYPQAKLLTTQGTGPSKARNMGIAQAKGEFVAFTDADCVVDSDWILELLKGFTNEKVAGAGGAQKSPVDETEFGKKVQEFLKAAGFISDYMKSGSKIRLTGHNPSCNVMYRKSILVECGGFLAGLWPGEDVELDYRIKKKGYLLMFNPQAVVYHYRPSNFKEFNRMMFNYGQAQGFLTRRYGFFRVIHFVPVIVVILTIISLRNMSLSCLILVSIILALLVKSSISSASPFLILRLFCAALFNWNLGFTRGLLKNQNRAI